jgi:hypothetical protein
MGKKRSPDFIGVSFTQSRKKFSIERKKIRAKFLKFYNLPIDKREFLSIIASIIMRGGV